MSSFIDGFLSGLNNSPTPPPSSGIPVGVQHLTMPTLALPLLDYQRDAVEFALAERSAYLALDMGLGKTACAIAVAVAVANDADLPVLIIVPPSLRTNWVREFFKFAPDIKVQMLTGNKPQDLSTSDADVFIIGDATIGSWKDELVGKISGIVVDEAHRTKNKNALRTKAVKEIADALPTDGIRILMSGTPSPNGRATELHTALDILRRWSVVGSASNFYKYFCPPADNGYGRQHIEERYVELGERLRASFMHRRLRDQVLNLPNKGRSTVALECRGAQAQRYKEAEQDIFALFNREDRSTDGLGKAEALVKLNFLRQQAGLAKVPALIAMLKEMMEDDSSGIMVVAEHSGVLNALMNEFAGKTVAIRGGMSDRDKTEAVDAFNNGDVQLLIGQITSVGVGFTLHGGGRNHRVVIAQLPWNSADLRQAEDRLHRMGQTHDVEVTICLSAIDGSWTIDERLWMLLDSKAFASSALENGVGETLTGGGVFEGVLDTYR